jgi:hypothetical protein
MASGIFQGDVSQCKATVPLYATLASTTTAAEFSIVLESGILRDMRELTIDERTLAMAGRSCCGHTCEGTCTPTS